MTSVSGKIDPVVRPIKAADIAEALGQGLRDFQAMPLYGLAFGALYAGSSSSPSGPWSTPVAASRSCFV